MKFRLFLAELVFFFHIFVSLLFIVPFFIPSSFWPSRIEFHFFYVLSIFVLFYAWGLIWTLKIGGKIYKKCVLDSFTQWLRGYSFFDPRNYDHWFIEELFGKFSFMKSFSRSSISYLTSVVVFLSFILYALKLKGVILW